MPRRRDGTAGFYARRYTPPGWITAMDVARLCGLKPEWAPTTIVKRHRAGKLFYQTKLHNPRYRRAFQRKWYVMTLAEAMEIVLKAQARHLPPARWRTLRDSTFGRTRAQRAKRLNEKLALTSPSSTTSSTNSSTPPAAPSAQGKTAWSSTPWTSPDATASENLK